MRILTSTFRLSRPEIRPTIFPALSCPLTRPYRKHALTAEHAPVAHTGPTIFLIDTRRRPEPVLPYTASNPGDPSGISGLPPNIEPKPLATINATTRSTTGHRRARHSFGSPNASQCRPRPRSRIRATASAACRGVCLGICRPISPQLSYPPTAAATIAPAIAVSLIAIQQQWPRCNANRPVTAPVARGTFATAASAGCPALFTSVWPTFVGIIPPVTTWTVA